MTATDTGPVSPPFRVGEVAVMFNADPATVRRLIKIGKLRAFRLGGDWRIPRDAVPEYIKANGNRPTDSNAA